MKFIYYKISRCLPEMYSKFISGGGPKEKKMFDSNVVENLLGKNFFCN
jgi:hypothetical protein